jgi:ubiquinone/menaquinone biosynthesis C-methylase UbiE
MRTKNYFPNINQIIKQNRSFVDVAKNKTYYREISEVYELMSARNKETPKEVLFLKRFIEKNSGGKKTLDLACGVGRHSRGLSKLGFQTFGVDQSKNMLKIAKKLDSKTKYKHADIRKFSLNTKVDIAFCLWTTYNYLSTQKDFQQFLNCVRDSLNQNGFLILESRNFFKKSNKLEFRRRLHENSRYKIELFIRKHINLKSKVQDAVYVYLVLDKSSGKTYSSIDTELVKIYSKEDIENKIKNKFRIFKIFGDYSESSYNKNTSDRLIFVLQKVN